MSFFSQRGGSILLQTVSGASCSVFLFLSSFAHAIVDTNSNGVSDLWERRFNTGSLFTDFDPAADPDGDGWTNLQEAAAGTDPRDANPPVGFIQPETERIPAVYNTPEEEGGEPTLASPEALHVFWPTLPGKNYSLFVSVDLGPQNWLPVGPPRIGSGSVLGALAPLTQADGNLADKSFWRVAVTDVDSDSDTLTDAEEHQLGTNPNHSDTDGDGLPDGWEIANGIDPKDGGSLNSGNGPAGDPDFDGLSNLLEWQHGGSSRLEDTDGDGMDDGPEFHAGLIITDRDENDNGSTDGYEDFDGDGYANREEAVAGTDPRNGAILPDGISNPSNPILLLRDPSQTSPNLLNRTESVETNLSRSSSFNYRIVDGGQRYTEFRKPGFLEFESGIVESAEIGASAGKTLQDYPAYYLTSTTSDLAEHAYRIQFYTDGEPDHLFSGSGDGNRTMIETTLKENGEYHYDMTQSGTIHYEDFIDGELSDEETLTFGVDPEASWPGLSGWNYHGLEVRSPVQTHEVWDYDYSSAYNSNGGSGPNTGHASKAVTLSSKYADPMLVADLTSALSAVSYSDSSAGAPSSASFLWENDHSAANMQDSKYRIETNGLPPGVLPNAKVVFFWKEVFESQDQKERITTWRSETAAPAGGGASTTSNHELLHPAKPGTISVSPSEAALDAPAYLRALNPGEPGLLESYETAADGQTHTRFTPASSEAIRFQVGLDEQTVAPTLRASGAGSVLLWRKVKDGPWQSQPLPYAIPAEQAAGAASEPGQYCLQGTQPGALTLELVVGGSVTASQTVQIVSVDLDVDSDNAAGLNASADEEQIESDNTRPGKIIVINPNPPTGMNDMPLSADGLVALQLRTDQLESGETISILYAPALMTIWNSGPGVLPTATQRIVPGQPYTLASLGLLPGQSKPLTIQAISRIGGLSGITVQVLKGDITVNDTVLVTLLPMEAAPEKLASNGDFDEGNTSNISAQKNGASADNRNQTLIAARDSVDSQVKAGDVVTTDLHEGWFGGRPGIMSDSFYDGAIVTITKKNITDPGTGKREEGMVRFFATWGGNQELMIQPDDPFLDELFTPNPAPRNLVGKVYGTSKTVPSGAKFWIEGVTLGKITLEYHIQKGDFDVTHEQTFEICNEWPRSKWERAVSDEIYLDSFTSSSGSALNGLPTTGLNLANYKVANGFLANRQYLYAVYEYYAKLHGQEPEKFLWAGLAKQAGAPVYAGLSDAQNGRAGLAIATFGIIDSATLLAIQDTLIQANIDIYKDLAYQFVAYRTGGIQSMEYLAENQVITTGNLSSWRQIDQNDGGTATANVAVLRREQEVILAQAYLGLNALENGKIAWMFSLLARNPVPLGPDFQSVVPSGNIAVFNDRWQWITSSGNGMWDQWMAFPEAQRLQFSNRILTDYADTFNLLAPLR